MEPTIERNSLSRIGLPDRPLSVQRVCDSLIGRVFSVVSGKPAKPCHANADVRNLG